MRRRPPDHLRGLKNASPPILTAALCLALAQADAQEPGGATARSGTVTSSAVTATSALGAEPITAPPLVLHSPELPPEIAVATYQGLDSPLEFRLAAQGKNARQRAKEASDALTAALERAEIPPGTRSAEARVEGDRVIVRVHGLVVTVLGPDDARAKDLELSAYAEQLEGQLAVFVPEQLRRRTLQAFVLHVFLSVLVIVLGALTLRTLRGAFDRWDELVESRGKVAPFTLFKIPIFSPETLGGLLAFALVVGRVAAYVITVLTALAVILGQFDATRPVLRRVASGSSEPLVRGAENLLGAIPGLVLAAVLVIALSAALRVTNLLLDGVAGKRFLTKRLTPPRVPAFRIVAATLLVLTAMPLAIAAAFGRFGTPLEIYVLAAAGAVALGSTPVIASSVAGIFVTWRQAVKEGEWVQIGDVRAEVAQVNLHEVHLVPEAGGKIIVPMLYLLLHPLRQLRAPPDCTIELVVALDRPMREILSSLRETLTAVTSEARVEPVSFSGGSLVVTVTAPQKRPDVRATLLVAIGDAIARGEIVLPAPPST